MKSITIYTTPACVYCKMAKKFFMEHGISFIEKDVMLDMQAQHEMIKKSGQLGVPVIDIDGEIVVGFDRPKIASILNI